MKSQSTTDTPVDHLRLYRVANNERVRKSRERYKAMGLRLVQLWVTDRQEKMIRAYLYKENYNA